MPWSVTDITHDLQVQVVRDMPSLSVDMEQAVEAIWQAALAANPTLFNGRIFSADHLTPSRIEGHWTEYRRAVAQMSAPDLALNGPRHGPGLQLRPLAVCGMLICHKNGRPAVLFGQRTDRTTYQQGMWQMPPAGSVDAKAAGPGGSVDVRRALLTELREEVGLLPDTVHAIRPLCSVQHPGTRVVDLGFALHTHLSAAEVLAAHAACGDAEYINLRIATLDEVAALTCEWGETLVPSAQHFLTRLSLEAAEAG